jgi:hypothetical protein
MPFGTQHKLVECLAGRSLTPEHGEASNSIVAQIKSIPLTEPAAYCGCHVTVNKSLCEKLDAKSLLFRRPSNFRKILNFGTRMHLDSGIRLGDSAWCSELES